MFLFVNAVISSPGLGGSRDFRGTFLTFDPRHLRGCGGSYCCDPRPSMAADDPQVGLLEAAQLLGIESTPWQAARSGNVEALVHMASCGVPLSHPDLARGWLPIQYAAENDRAAALAYLYKTTATRTESMRGPGPVWIAANTESISSLEVLIEHGASLDDDYQHASPIEALCRRRTPPSDRQLRCVARLVLAGACVSAGYVDEAARPSLKAWAVDQLTSQYAPVFIAMAARAGRDAAGAPCPLAALDGRMLTIVGAFLRRSKKEVRRVHRLLWILEAEDVDDVRRAAAAARGWRRADHCFVVS